MGEVTKQSNAKAVSGQGLNAPQNVSNIEGDISITQELIRNGTITFSFGHNSNTVTHFRQWNPFQDNNTVDRFLEGDLTSATYLFNYYKLTSVEYTFFISALTATRQNWQQGFVILRACFIPSTSRMLSHQELPCPKITSELQQLRGPAGADNTDWRGMLLQVQSFNPNTTGGFQNMFIRYFVKFIVEFIGRKWLPIPSLLNLLGADYLGKQLYTGSDAPVSNPDGAHGLIHSCKCPTQLSGQTSPTQTLACENESTDKEKSIPCGSKTELLGGSFNKHWKGYNKRSSSQVLELHQEKRSRSSREGGPTSITYKYKEQEDQERRDNGHDSVREKMQ